MGANSEWNVKYQYSNILPLHAFDMRFSFDDVSKEIRLSQDLYVIQSIEGENHSHGTSRRRERRYEEEEEEEDEDYSEDEREERRERRRRERDRERNERKDKNAWETAYIDIGQTNTTR